MGVRRAVSAVALGSENVERGNEVGFESMAGTPPRKSRPVGRQEAGRGAFRSVSNSLSLPPCNARLRVCCWQCGRCGWQKSSDPKMAGWAPLLPA